MIVESHFDIQAHKLSQVTVSVGVLGPENWNNVAGLDEESGEKAERFSAE